MSGMRKEAQFANNLACALRWPVIVQGVLNGEGAGRDELATVGSAAEPSWRPTYSSLGSGAGTRVVAKAIS
jgi:hypothetical protein